MVSCTLRRWSPRWRLWQLTAPITRKRRLLTTPCSALPARTRMPLVSSRPPDPLHPCVRRRRATDPGNHAERFGWEAPSEYLRELTPRRADMGRQVESPWSGFRPPSGPLHAIVRHPCWQGFVLDVRGSLSFCGLWHKCDPRVGISVCCLFGGGCIWQPRMHCGVAVAGYFWLQYFQVWLQVTEMMEDSNAACFG